jgi:beta-glucosidase/6-phospho-beta-glucosidase/beta-galactosidase
MGRSEPEQQERFGSDQETGIFPTFFFAGFECSTFVWKDRQRKDYVTLTGHDRHLEPDYERVMDLGIGVVREAVRWPIVDRGGGRYDWSTVDPLLKVMDKSHITPIWDLCHYGLPDGCDPLSRECLPRFVDYCRAVAEYVRPRTREPRFFTPVNEITFTSGAATDMGWFYPYARGRYDAMKTALCRMAIEGVKAIRQVIPDARMVHVDPIIHEIPAPGHPELEQQAWEDAYDKAYEAWDMLYGRLRPELGGTPEILDIVGVNVYAFCEAQINADGSREALSPRDPRRKPLSDMLMYAWERYHRPIIIGETSGSQDGRAEWLRMVMQESLKALNSGIDLQGICLYPCVDIQDWNTGKLAQIGIYDLKDSEHCERVPCQNYVDELRRWEKILDHPDDIEADTLSRSGLGTVQLSEVRECARKWEEDTPGRQQANPAGKQAA